MNGCYGYRSDLNFAAVGNTVSSLIAIDIYVFAAVGDNGSQRCCGFDGPGKLVYCWAM